MDIPEHIARLRTEGALLAGAAERLDLNAPVRTCPEWQLRDLVRHVGGIHLWAAGHVAGPLAEPMADPEVDALMSSWPDDGHLVDWYRQAHASLVDTLERAEPDVMCWTFLSAPSPLAFWARRQAHETGIHRADAESADTQNGAATPFPPGFAADGIDELLVGFFTRPRSRVRSEEPRTIGVDASDTGDHWLVEVSPDPPRVSRREAKADCSLRGAASDLYLMLWNRRSTEGLEVSGDPSLLELWRDSAQIRWS